MSESVCFGTINACMTRFTRLNADGSVADGPNNSYVSDALVDVTATLVKVDAVEKEVINGCGCPCLSYVTPARNKRFDVTLNLCTWDPQIVEMLTGADIILDGSDDPLGWWWAYAEQCSDFTPAAVAVEVWSERRLGGAALAPGLYEQWLFPGENFTIGDFTLGADFAVPSLVGTGFANTEWGEGPYGDAPESAGAIGGAFITDTLPTAACAYATAGS
jgi:hypothetical protein